MNRAAGARGALYTQAPRSEDVLWELQGKCNDYDPDMFQPVTEVGAQAAKWICKSCPVMIQCRDWALVHHEISGVWGGLSEQDRASFWAGRTIRHRHRTA